MIMCYVYSGRLGLKKEDWFGGGGGGGGKSDAEPMWLVILCLYVGNERRLRET
jgi:hypothetical protein